MTLLGSRRRTEASFDFRHIGTSSAYSAQHDLLVQPPELAPTMLDPLRRQRLARRIPHLRTSPIIVEVHSLSLSEWQEWDAPVD